MVASNDVPVMNQVDLIEVIELDIAFFDNSLAARDLYTPVIELLRGIGEGSDDRADWLRRHDQRDIPAMEARRMCIPLIGKVVDVDGPIARVELTSGHEVRVNASLHPEVGIGEHVLLDRGLIVEIIDESEKQSLMELYEELDSLWREEMASNE